MTDIDATIVSLGHLGDGVVETPEGQIFVPFALPGERVRVRMAGEGRADLVELLAPAPERVSPPCRHFGVCGGCALQHMDVQAYGAWKREQVVAALAARGLDVAVGDLVPAHPRSRRRASFAATRTKKGVTLGYYGRASHTIVAVEECPLIVGKIEGAIEGLAHLVEAGLSRKGRAALAVTATETGLDVAVTGGKEVDGPLRAELAKRAAAIDLARLTWEGDILAERRPPTVTLSGLKVAPPPGGFLQATAEGEAALVRLVLDGVGAGAARVADLFAGCGTFAAALARQATVVAVESDEAALKAFDRALRRQGPALGLKPVELLQRDLFRRPMLASELAKIDAVVFDPPRAGAAAQAMRLAESNVPIIVAVSCNPATFARDARTLVDGGYKLVNVTPVDQFLWSPHIELVGLFQKG